DEARRRNAPEMALAPSLPPARPAAWFAAMATGRSCWFCRIWLEMPCSVWAVSTPTVEVSLCTWAECAGRRISGTYQQRFDR
nr:hypothetical protein [Tanacetum cinerariifolium]